MPVNRNALIRYKTIDLCLQNRYRKWTLDDLIDACSEALYEYEGIDKGVGRRTIQLDIQLMRSDKLGYNAPIIVTDKKYYSYEDPDYSIMNIPISESDLDKLTETVDFLKQFKGFSHFRELDSMVQKLEDHVYSKKINRKPVIDFEKNEDLKGIDFLEKLYQAIIRKNIIEITYQSFNARQANTFRFYPYLLKEFRNRWFLIGSKNNAHPLLNLAIDRIVEVNHTEKIFADGIEFDASEYFKDVIGVTVNHGSNPETVVLFVTRKHAPYVLTKPFHPSQKLLEKNDYGITISLEVQHNFELEKEILGLGDGVVVLAPDRLKANITERLNNTLDQYNTTISEKGIISLTHKYIRNGFCAITQLYSKRSINQLAFASSKENHNDGNSSFPKTLNPGTDINLKAILLNPSVEKVLAQLVDQPIATEVTFYDRIPDDFFEFKQSGNFSQLEMIVLLSQPKSKTFAVQVVPGSHKKLHSEEEKKYIVENCVPADCPISTGGALITNAALLRSFSTSFKNEAIRFLMIRIDAGLQVSDQLDSSSLGLKLKQ